MGGGENKNYLMWGVLVTVISGLMTIKMLQVMYITSLLEVSDKWGYDRDR